MLSQRSTPVGRFASRLEAAWDEAFAAWGLAHEYLGDRLPHIDFAVRIGSHVLPVEIKPLTADGGPVDAAMRRFAALAGSRMAWAWQLDESRLPDDRLLVLAGEPAAARLWFAACAGPGLWIARAVEPPIAIHEAGQPPRVTWPVGSDRWTDNPVPCWLADVFSAARGPAGGDCQLRLFDP